MSNDYKFGSIIQDVLRDKYKDCEYSVGETYESLNWLDKNKVKPSLNELKLAIQDYLANEEKYNYANLRALEYPSFADQLDMLWHAMDNGEIAVAKEFYEARKAVKDKYPKFEGDQ